jgi:hypothetical protein
MEGWTMTIMDTDEKILIGGIRLVVGSLLIENYRVSCPGLPEGHLMLLDLDGKQEGADPERDNFATRFALVYVTEV